MAETSIEWTRGDDGTPGATWNPILGCSRVSPGCDNCYAINSATIRAGNPHPRVAAAFAGLTERRDGRLDWTGSVNLLPERLTQPLKWRKPKRIFVNSLADLFHDDVPDEYIAKVFGVMALAPQHTFQLLTKRHGRMRSLLSRKKFREQVQRAALKQAGDRAPWLVEPWWPLRNVWLGVSVEDQKWADVRIPALLDTPAAVRWLSCEPLLGPLDLHAKDSRTFGPQWLPVVAHGVNAPDAKSGDGSWIGGLYKDMYGPNIDWVVCGGESGPGARPMHPDWARTLRDQCGAAGVPFFFKQWGNWQDGSHDPRTQRGADHVVLRDGRHTEFATFADSDLAKGDPAQRYGACVMSRVGKKDAGRELDGRTWDEYPQSRVEAVSRG